MLPDPFLPPIMGATIYDRYATLVEDYNLAKAFEVEGLKSDFESTYKLLAREPFEPGENESKWAPLWQVVRGVR